MTKTTKTPDLVRVWPAPDLVARGGYLPGVGIDGAEVPADRAAEWVDAGLAVLTPPTYELED